MRTTMKSIVAVAGIAALALTGCVADTQDDAAASTNGEATEDAAAGSEDALILGLVPSQDLAQLVEDGDALAALLADELGRDVEAYVSDNYAGLVTAMQTGQADIGMFGPIALVQAVEQADAEAVLQAVRYGSDTYVTQWFTNDPDTYCMDEPAMATSAGGEHEMLFCNGTDEASEGPIGEEALELIEAGETISFVDEGSASGYYYPATQLQTLNGLDPFTDLDAQFAGGHPNSVLNVFSGEIAVGVSFDDARQDVYEEEPTVGEEVVVFAYSESIPNDGIAVNGELTDDEQQAIIDAFMALTETDDGLQILDDVYGMDGLVPANLDALDAARDVAANFGE